MTRRSGSWNTDPSIDGVPAVAQHQIISYSGGVTLDEQRQVRATNLIRLEDKEKELQCCRLKGRNIVECWNGLGQFVTGRMQDAVSPRELADYPPKEEVQSLIDDILRLTTEIANLKHLLYPPAPVTTIKPE